VLLLIGLAGMLMVNANSVSNYFRENMQVSVMFKQAVTEDVALEYKADLDKQRFVKSSLFVSKEQGRREMAEMLGEDFLDVFEVSPIPVSIDVTLSADYVSADSLEVVKTEIAASPLVDEVVYQQSLVETLNTNLNKVSAVFAIFIALLLFISFVLINNTVRLNVFARRFTIHTMKLVGATRSFIRAPFLVRAVFQALFSAFIALIVLLGLLFFVKSNFQQLFDVFQMEHLLVVAGVVVVSGLLICVTSTYFVVNKLISLKKD
jgi:cell division transport system permease protein